MSFQRQSFQSITCTSTDNLARTTKTENTYNPRGPSEQHNGVGTVVRNDVVERRHSEHPTAECWLAIIKLQ